MKPNVTRIKLYYLIKLWTQLHRHTHSTPVILHYLLLSFWLKPEAAEMTHCSFNLLRDQFQIYWLYCRSVNCLTVCVCVELCRRFMLQPSGVWQSWRLDPSSFSTSWLRWSSSPTAARRPAFCHSKTPSAPCLNVCGDAAAAVLSVD